jgi:hypothetical protein
MENEAQNLENSPVLLPGFTEKVMSSIDTEYYSAQKGSIPKLRRFNQFYRNIPKIAVAVVIILVITSGFLFNKSIPKISSKNRIADSGKQTNSISTQENKTDLSQKLDKPNKNPSNINESKSFTKTDLSSNKNEEMTIYNDPKQTSVTSQGTFLKSTESSIISTAQMRLEPINISSKYELTNTSDNQQNVIFTYTAINQSGEFTVTISPELANETLKASSYAPDNCPAPDILSSPVSWKIKYNDRTYTVILNGNIPVEELQELGNSIGFEEKPCEN